MPRLRRTRARNRLAAVAAALVAALAISASASAIDPILVDASTGMAAPAGAFRDTNGDLWVSDHLGICRVVDPPHGGNAIVEDPTYCGLGRTVGPVAPSQATFDRTSGLIFVGDGASAGGAVWRFQLNQSVNPAVIDSGVMILALPGDRVFGMSHHRAANGDIDVAFSTKNSPSIQTIPDAQLCPQWDAPLPLVPCGGIPSGAAEGEAASLAYDGDGNIYIADTLGVTRIGRGAPGTATPVTGLYPGAYSALAFDPDNDGGRLYAGTTNPEGADWIDVLNLGSSRAATYSVGFDGVTAIAVDPASTPFDGRLDVIDDTCVKQICEDVSRARRFTVDFEMSGPRPEIVDGPPAVTNAAVPTFFFRYPSTTTFYCSLNGAPPTECGTAAQGSIAYPGLPNGAHTFTVLANHPVIGTRVTRRFALDTRAPVVTITSATIVGSSAEFALATDDPNVDWTCRMDGGVPTPCDSPVRYPNLANGPHTFTVHATDFVGNVGPQVTSSFQIGALPGPPWKPGAITATLRGLNLRVVFNAPPDATFARFVLSKTSGVKVRTRVVRVKPGAKNTVTVRLTRAEALRLQRQTVTLRVTAGATTKGLTTKAGQGKLKVAAKLAPTGKAR